MSPINQQQQHDDVDSPTIGFMPQSRYKSAAEQQRRPTPTSTSSNTSQTSSSGRPTGQRRQSRIYEPPTIAPSNLSISSTDGDPTSVPPLTLYPGDSRPNANSNTTRTTNTNIGLISATSTVFDGDELGLPIWPGSNDVPPLPQSRNPGANAEKKSRDTARGISPEPPMSPSAEDFFIKPLKKTTKPAANGDASKTGATKTGGLAKTFYPPIQKPTSSEAESQDRVPELASSQSLAVPGGNDNANGVNRYASTASISTVRASRGSPPPPETPIADPVDAHGRPGGNSTIEDRYAVSGIPGASTLTALQAQQVSRNLQTANAAAAARTAQYAQPKPRQASSSTTTTTSRRPWTPTEAPGDAPHGPPTVYQGGSVISESDAMSIRNSSHQSPPRAPRNSTVSSVATARLVTSPLPTPRVDPTEQDMARMNLNNSPPPAYTSIKPAGSSNVVTYPDEKARSRTHRASEASTAPTVESKAERQSALGPHPAYSQPVQQYHAQQAQIPTQHSGQSTHSLQQAQYPQCPQLQQSVSANRTGGSVASAHQTGEAADPAAVSPAQTVTSPPPLLPEGWIAHIDPASQQYYYIHLPTQATQWEFPKGPTPLNLTEPMSPITTQFANPLLSPTFGFDSMSMHKTMLSPGIPTTPGYAASVMSFGGASVVPSLAGFTGPPPASGVEMYRVAPTNGVYFGPYLKYVNMDIARGIWYGSILLVTDALQPPSIHIHQSVDLSPNPRQLKPISIHKHQRWAFFKYEVDLQMEEHGSAKWTYAITSHLGCTRYEFLVAGKHDTNWRFIATSGNDFSLNVKQEERTRLGGTAPMWKDIMSKHAECGGFHAQLGLGDQIYADRIWKDVPVLKQWLGLKGKDTRKSDPWTARHEEDVAHAYFHYYSSHFDQPFLREAFAQIPHLLQINDHDIFDGFGSYPEHMQHSNVFKNIGRIAIDTYLLFQHHTTLELLRNVSDDHDIFTITGTGWHFVKFLGPAVAVVGIDCRSERTPTQVMAGPTYQGIFPKIAMLPDSVQHCLIMLSNPVVYPRLETAEQLASTIATGKKAVTGTYNMLSKVTAGVAGIVGGKELVGNGFKQVKQAVGKTGLMGNILSPFGDIDLLDELKDQWTHSSKDLERTYLIRTLQGIAHQRSIRMTFLSGGTDLCGAGILHDPSKPGDHKTMYQLISSSVVNGPPPNYVIRLLHNSKPSYIPLNGVRSSTGATPSPSDTKEEMMEVFQIEPDGQERPHKKLMARRNYAAIVTFDPEALGAMDDGASMYSSGAGSNNGKGRLSLAVDFMVQTESVGVCKYGPVIVPCVEFGR